MQCHLGHLLLTRIIFLVAPHTNTGVKTRQHHLKPASPTGILVLEVTRNNAQLCAQRPDIAARLPQNAHVRTVTLNRVEFPGKQLQQCGFTGTIRSQNHGTTPLLQNQVEAVKYFCDTSKYRGIAYFYQRRPAFSHEPYL